MGEGDAKPQASCDSPMRGKTRLACGFASRAFLPRPITHQRKEAAVRFGDILRLSLSALWQQKVRSILTTLGVVFGTFVLVASVSVNRGVQETILRESQKHGELQRVQAYSVDEPAPTEQIAVKGAMTEDKRKRLRKTIERREQRGSTPTGRTGLTPRRLAG